MEKVMRYVVDSFEYLSVGDVEVREAWRHALDCDCEERAIEIALGRQSAHGYDRKVFESLDEAKAAFENRARRLPKITSYRYANSTRYEGEGVTLGQAWFIVEDDGEVDFDNEVDYNEIDCDSSKVG